jgi:hypothetical protein
VLLITRNPQDKGGSHVKCASQLHVTAVFDRDTLDNRRSQSGPTGGTTERLINTEKNVRNPVLVFGFDAPALIRDSDLHETVRQPRADRHRATRRRAGHRIVDQVRHRSHQRRCITGDPLGESTAISVLADSTASLQRSSAPRTTSSTSTVASVGSRSAPCSRDSAISSVTRLPSRLPRASCYRTGPPGGDHPRRPLRPRPAAPEHRPESSAHG